MIGSDGEKRLNLRIGEFWGFWMEKGHLSLLLLPGGVEETLSLPLLILDIKILLNKFQLAKYSIKIFYL